MFGKKIIIYVVFALVVFAGSSAVMIMLGRFVKEPEVVKEELSDAKQLSVEGIPDSKINKIIWKMYYKDIDEWYDYDTKSKEASMLLNVIKPNKIISEIEELKEKYEAKNLELKGKEEKLLKLKEELVSERKKIDLIKKDLSNDLEMINKGKQSAQDIMAAMGTEEANNMKLLANIYEGMKPKQAAAIIAEMDRQTAVKLLKLMDQRNSAKILQDVEPSMAVRLSEQIRKGSMN